MKFFDFSFKSELLFSMMFIKFEKISEIVPFKFIPFVIWINLFIKFSVSSKYGKYFSSKLSIIVFKIFKLSFKSFKYSLFSSFSSILSFSFFSLFSNKFSSSFGELIIE